MKDTYYFSHDFNARHDPKILAMRSVFGAKGYGWYWMIIEMMREEKNYMLKLSKYIWNILSMQLGCQPEEAEEYISACINEFDLFATDDEFIWSNSLLKRMEVKERSQEANKKRAQKAAEARWGKSKKSSKKQQKKDIKMQEDSSSDAEEKEPSMLENEEQNANAMLEQCLDMPRKESKRKEKKVKESKVYHHHSHDDGDNADDDNSQISYLEFLEREFGRTISKSEYDTISSFEDDFDNEMIIEAITRAVLNQARTVKYVTSILQNWKKSGVKNLDDVKQADERHQQKKSFKKTPSKPVQQERGNSYHFDEDLYSSRLGKRKAGVG